MDLSYGAMGRKGGAFLPADEVRDVVAGHEDAAVGFGEAGVTGQTVVFLAEVLDPRAQIVRNMTPGNVSRLGEFL